MPNYRAILGEFQDELARLLKDRDFVQKQIDRISKAIADIQVLAQESDEPIMEPPPLSPSEEPGFTDRVRSILRSNPLRPLTAVEIRDVLLKTSPKDDPKIMLIHVHNTLKRLDRQDEVEEVPGVDGRNAYRWTDPMFRGALAGLAGLDLPGAAAAFKSLPPLDGPFPNPDEKTREAITRKPAQAPIPPASMRRPLPGLESISAGHPVDKLRAPKPPLTPGEAKRMMENLRGGKK